MLSYQHEYHSGNIADIFKHTVLCLILESLCKKEKPFTVIDSHAGAGIFDLEDERLLKTGEAKEGIEKLMRLLDGTHESVPHGLREYIALEKPYIARRTYAGSPEIEHLYARSGDSLHFVEKHPQALASLSANMKQKKVHIHNEDSYKALDALTPPAVRRGLVLCDPSYEDADDYKKVCESLKTVRRKWNTAVIALWYPLLLRRKNETARLLTELEDFCKLGTAPCGAVRCELTIKDPVEKQADGNAHLYGSGMLILNPPWKLKEDLAENAAFLEKLLRT